MARLDRLATVKEVVQVGAALGRTFHYELLRATASMGDTTLQRALARFGEADPLHQRGVPRQQARRHAGSFDLSAPRLSPRRLRDSSTEEFRIHGFW